MIRLGYAHMLQDSLDGTHGLPRARLAELARRFAAVQAEVRRRRAAGEYGFYQLVDQGETVREIKTFAEGLGQAHDHVLILGIGGSALGTKALLAALRRPAWNEWDDEGREFFPRLTVLDNVDPTTINAALRRIDPRRVLVNVISKSGGTAETMAQYLVVRAWLEDALGSAAHRHLVFTTDPSRGALREIAARDGIATLSMPPNVGGRYSVLSPVGLLPAALVGIDIDALLAGADGRWSGPRRTTCSRTPRPSTRRFIGRPIPTSARGSRADALFRSVARIRRVVSPALGREPGQACRPRRQGRARGTDPGGGRRRHRPAQPGAALHGGAVRQGHHVRRDRRRRRGRQHPPDGRRPAGVEPLPADLAYLPGHTLGELLHVEYEATATALAQRGRMSCTLRLPDLSAASFGELVMFYQIATGYAGEWYGIDPFDQPGVELGKRLTYAAMGRPGYDAPSRAGGEVRDEA